jgi:glycosyltransferase involved in cell wall biosynthesis
MLSICIPVFNLQVSQLVHELHNQGQRMEVPFEILIIDDASEESLRKENRSLGELQFVRYEELTQNIGRSKIRNLLAVKAKFPLLLFLDCDAEIISKDFLKRYLDSGKDGSVVCGGHVYQTERPPHPYTLHWLAGSKREVAPAIKRQQNPHQSFMTGSFLVPSSLLYQLPFNEELYGYGHEDTLYGYQLMKRGIAIKHIDNPILHNGLDTATEFLNKTRQSLLNLRIISEFTKNDPEFIDMVSVLKVCQLFKRYKMHKLFAIMFIPIEKTLAKRLTGKRPSLWVLDLYKLGTICQYS